MICPTCKGRGHLYEVHITTSHADWRKPCSACGGRGVLTVAPGETCPCECGKAPLISRGDP